MLDRSVLSQRTNEITIPPYPEDEDGWSLGAEGDVTHQLLSFESVIANPNLILGDRFIPIPVPDNVQKATFEINNIPMECWHSTPMEEPQAIIGFLPGTKMPAWAYQTERNILHSMGFAITALTQTNPISKKGFIPHHVDAAEAFIFDAESPLYTMGRPDIPRIIITHSANGPRAGCGVRTTLAG